MNIMSVLICVYFLVSLPLMVCASVLANERHVLAAGEYHCLFIDNNGLVWGWGDSLGLGLASDPQAPQIVFEKAVSVAAGSFYSLALREDGSVWCRGCKHICSIRAGYYDKIFPPTNVFDDGIDFGVGPEAVQAFVIKGDRSLWGWGVGRPGLGFLETESFASAPQRILGNVEQVAIGSGHILALVRTDPATKDGKELQLMGWGSNDYLQLGEYDLANRTVPISLNPWRQRVDVHESIQDSLPIIKVAAAGDASYALLGDGTVWGWGNISCTNDWREQRIWDTEARRSERMRCLRFRKLEGMDKVQDIAAGRKGLLTLKEDGTLWGRFWHRGTFFEAENIIRANDDHWAFILDDVQEMAAGSYHGIALKKDGTVWTWGNNNRGQLGRSKENDYTTPIQVVFPSPEETAIQLKEFRKKMKYSQQ